MALPDPADVMPAREQLLEASPSTLAAYGLAVVCRCNRTRTMPMRELGRRVRGRPLADCIPRLRCNDCGDPPAVVRVTLEIPSPGGAPDHIAVEVFRAPLPTLTREQLLASTLHELRGHVLRAPCPAGCAYTEVHPLSMLAGSYPGERLVDVLPKLRCAKCSRAPATGVVYYVGGGAPMPVEREVQVWP